MIRTCTDSEKTTFTGTFHSDIACSCFDMLCCIVFCCAGLCGAVLCCVVLWCVVLCCVVLLWIVLCCVVLYCVVFCCAGLCGAVLCCVVLCCTVLCCIVLCCVVLLWVVLCCVMLCCVVGSFDAVIVMQNTTGMNRLKITYNSLSSAVGPTVECTTGKADKRNFVEQFACRRLLNVKCALNVIESTVC